MAKRPQIGSGDRILWPWLSRHWSGWQDALVFVQTGTVIAWQHLSLGMDSPESRSVQSPDLGKVVQFPAVGGLHHHYERLAA